MMVSYREILHCLCVGGCVSLCMAPPTSNIMIRRRSSPACSRKEILHCLYTMLNRGIIFKVSLMYKISITSSLEGGDQEVGTKRGLDQGSYQFGLYIKFSLS